MGARRWAIKEYIDGTKAAARTERGYSHEEQSLLSNKPRRTFNARLGDQRKQCEACLMSNHKKAMEAVKKFSKENWLTILQPKA